MRLGVFFCLLAFTCLAIAQPQLDSQFGQQGLASHHLGDEDQLVDIRYLADGRILALGQSKSGDPFSGSIDEQLVLMMLKADGRLDLSYGQQGMVQDTFIGYPKAEVVDMALQSDGKVLVLGQGYAAQSPSRIMLVRRYLPDGKVDITFGQQGQTNLSYLSDLGYPRVVKCQPNGTIMLAGYTFDTAGVHRELPFIARLKADGQPDSSWGLTGKLALDFAQGPILLNESRDNTAVRHLNGGYIQDIILRPDGKIWAGGAKYNGSYYESILLLFHSTGQLDSTFGQNGSLQLTPDLASQDDHSIKQLALLDDGRLFCLFEMETFVRDFFVGIVDLEKSSVRYQEIDFAGQEDIGEALYLQADQHLLVLGRSISPANYTPTYPGDQLSLCRIKPDDMNLDLSFGQQGKWSIQFPTTQAQAAFAIDTDCQGNWGLAGLTETGRLPDRQDFAVWQFTASSCVVSREPTLSTQAWWVDAISKRLHLPALPYPIRIEAIDPIGRTLFLAIVPPGQTQLDLPYFASPVVIRLHTPYQQTHRWLF